MSFLNYAGAVGNLVACSSNRPSPSGTLGVKTTATLLGTTVAGYFLELTEVRLLKVGQIEEIMEFHADEVRWSPERASILCDGLQLERGALGNVLVQQGNFQKPQTFAISGQATTVFNVQGSFEVLQNGLVFCSEAGWTCVIAVTPNAKVRWQPSSKNSGVFRFEFNETKEFCFVVTTDIKKESAIKMAREALEHPEVIFRNSKKMWRQYFEEDVPPYPLKDTLWKSLSDMCWYVLKGNRMIYGEPPLKESFTCPSKFTYRHQWLWDSVFSAIGLRWLRDKTSAIEEFDNILSNQYSDGMLPHELFPSPFLGKIFWPEGVGGGSTVAPPPVLGMGIEKVFELTKDHKWLQRTFPIVQRYIDWFLSSLDSDGDGLVALRHAFESSWDNSPRWDESLREGRRLVPPVETVDTNCLIVCELHRLARWSRMLGQDEAASNFEKRATYMIEAIRSIFWDEQDKFFYDVDESTHRKVRVKTPAVFFTFLGGIATSEQEKALLSHLTNPEEFWTKYPVPSVARNEKKFTSKDMFRGPTWANINWLVIQGLRMRGHNELAKELATRTLNMMISQGRPEVREWYDPDTGESCGALNYSWSAGVAIDLMMSISHNI